MVSTSFFWAASRLSPKMIAYHLKRAFRNRFCRRFPALYGNFIARIAAEVPPLVSGGSSGLRMAEAVTLFYYDEYIASIDDAARGTITFFGQTVDFGSPANIDWHHKVAAENDFHLWRMKLAHMGFVCPMLISGTEKHLKAVGEIIAGHRVRIRYDQPGGFSSYLFPYSISHRILSLTSGYLIARKQRTLPVELCRQIEDFLRWNVGFVLANIEHELKNNHVERNLAALCFYFSSVAEVPAGLVRRLDRDVARIISDCILEDGLLAERSAMYQGLAVMALRIFEATEFLSPTTRALAATRLKKASRAWALLTHPDGEIALFNDSWFGEVPEASTVVPKPIFDPVELLPVGGYARLESGVFFALFDAGPIGPRWNPGHGHADFLSVELDVGGRRFIVDPGTYQYSTGERRHFERSAQSHNGPTRIGLEPIDYQGCFRVGKMSEARLIDSMVLADGGSVTGVLQLPKTVLQRELHLSRDGVRCLDCWTGDTSEAMVRLLIPTEWSVVRRSANDIVFANGSMRVQLRLDAGVVAGVEPGCYARRYLQSESALLITLKPDAAAAPPTKLIWSVARLADAVPAPE